LKTSNAALHKKNHELKKRLAANAAAGSALKTTAKALRLSALESKRLQEQLRHLSHRTIHALEEERKRISRELHDEVSSTLTGVNIELNLLENEVPRSNEKLVAKLVRTQQLVLTATQNIHCFARELRPAILDDLGLIPSLHSLTKKISTQSRLQIRLTIFAGVETLGMECKTALYRVIQEALSNVVKHAGANKVEVALTLQSGLLALVIHDDGRSFQASRFLRSAEPKRLGLLGMRERIEMLGGEFAIQSQQGQGTTIRGSIPNLAAAYSR
jgi:signal transduction histidine kinase